MAADKTALITGASRGIGVCFARELAARGFDLVLSARSSDRLETVRRELAEKYNVAVQIIACDLESPDGARRLFDEAQRRGALITMLVNNAGLGKFGSTLDQSLDEILSMIQVNTTSLTVLARLFGEQMAARGGGYILNHASFSAIQPPSQYAVYSGTKAYVLAFSQALREDLKRHRVRVTALCPGFFQSEFAVRAGHKPGWIVRQLMMKPEDVARAGIRATLRGQAVVIPGWSYKLLNLVTRGLPRSVATGLADLQ
jgi:short-subunit dehydrogenase